MTTTLDTVKEFLSSSDCYPFMSFSFEQSAFVGWYDTAETLVTGVYANSLTILVIDFVAQMALDATKSSAEKLEYVGMVFVPGGSVLGGLEREYAKERGVIVAICQPTKRGLIHVLESTR